MLLLKFASYLWFFYYTHTDLAQNESNSSMRSELVASDLLPALVTNPGATNVLKNSDKYQSLKTLRAAAQEERLEKDKRKYPIYVNVLILTYSVTTIIFASIYVLDAIKALS